MTKAAELAKMGEILSNSQIGRKNIIINGGMQVAQRGTSSTGLGGSSGIYPTLDRVKIGVGNTDGRFTMSQSAVTDLEGFSNALKIDCTTADTSVAANEFLILQLPIEGFDAQQLKATSTTTRAFTLSFYAKSNASRAISSEVNFTNGTNRSASKLHTIGTSWARYTFTIPAASSTQVDNDNSHELSINFWLHAGTTYSSGTMSASLESITNANRAAGIGSIFASTDNEIEITGIQLEVGSQATPFEHRSFGEELLLCKRYYHQLEYDGAEKVVAIGMNIDTSSSVTVYHYPIEMRSAPSVSTPSVSGGYRMRSADDNNTHTTFPNLELISTDGMQIASNAHSSLTAGQGVTCRLAADGAKVKFDAEL
jgi:hypothetical protein